jgi:hypothetical protein
MVEITFNTFIEAIESKGFVTYKQIGNMLDYPPEFVDRLFYEVDEKFKENGLPPLTTVMVNSEDFQVGAGYFREHYPNVKDKEKTWITNLNKLYSNTEKVRDLLK